MVCPAVELSVPENLFVEIRRRFCFIERELTSFEQLIPQQGVHRHPGIYSSNSALDTYSRPASRVHLVQATIDTVEIDMHFFKAAASGDVFLAH